jgi:hypothetical protein
MPKQRLVGREEPLSTMREEMRNGSQHAITRIITCTAIDYPHYNRHYILSVIDALKKRAFGRKHW